MQHVLEPGSGRAWVESPYLRSLIVSASFYYRIDLLWSISRVRKCRVHNASAVFHLEGPTFWRHCVSSSFTSSFILSCFDITCSHMLGRWLGRYDRRPFPLPPRHAQDKTAVKRGFCRIWGLQWYISGRRKCDCRICPRSRALLRHL